MNPPATPANSDEPSAQVAQITQGTLLATHSVKEMGKAITSYDNAFNSYLKS